MPLSKDPHEHHQSQADALDVSIVIVSWNTREILKACLETVYANLEGLRAEVFVVDNASSDNSAEMVAAHFPEVRLIVNDRNLGFARANNQAILQSSGRHILLLNSDTVVLGDVLQKSVQYMDSNPSVGVMGCRVLNADGSVQLTCSRLPSLLNLLLLTSGLFRLATPSFFGRYQLRDWMRDTERDVETVTGCYMMVRRQALQQVGMLDESFFFYGEETDWCKRFSQAGWPLRFAPVGEIVHYGSLSSKQCNHRRDLMLTSGLLRFHLKHNGKLAAGLAWCLLGVFCVLRSLYWAVVSVLQGGSYAEQRRRHFWNVLKGFGGVWPKTTEPAL